MPLFAKCSNPRCYCYGQFQLMGEGCCRDCGLPFGSTMLHIVTLNGPEPKEFQIEGASSADEAAFIALKRIQEMGLEPNHFKVTTVYGPDDIPQFDDAA